MHVDMGMETAALVPDANRVFECAAPRIRSLHDTWDPSRGSPVYTVKGAYTSRGWTDWTLGFHVGMALLQFDATGDGKFLELGREKTRTLMPVHLTHIGVHDHGFNNVSTYGNLRRLVLERRIAQNPWELEGYELALRVSGAVQAARWSTTNSGKGFIYSFNGPHSLFADTIRSLRSLVLSHSLGQVLMGEGDRQISLLGRAIEHADTTARYNVYYGEGRDAYDVAGRVAHESIFNTNDGQYRCPSSQQGYSPFTTWTRGAAWVMLGYAELLEYLATLEDGELEPLGGRESVERLWLRAARRTSDYYIDGYTSLDGIPFWDTGAPGLRHLEGYQSRISDPHNRHEPVDSSAAAIAAQGLIRLGRYLGVHGESGSGDRYLRAGLCVARTLFDEPYLSTDPDHQDGTSSGCSSM